MAEGAGAAEDGDGGGSGSAEDAVRDGAEEGAADAVNGGGSDEYEVVIAGGGFVSDAGIDVAFEENFGADVLAFLGDPGAGEGVGEDLLAYVFGDVIDIGLDVEGGEGAFGAVGEAFGEAEGAAGIGAAGCGYEDAGAGGWAGGGAEAEEKGVAAGGFEEPASEAGGGSGSCAAGAALFSGDEEGGLEVGDFIGNRPEGVGGFRRAEGYFRPVFCGDFGVLGRGGGVLAEGCDRLVDGGGDFGGIGIDRFWRADTGAGGAPEKGEFLALCDGDLERPEREGGGVVFVGDGCEDHLGVAWDTENEPQILDFHRSDSLEEKYRGSVGFMGLIWGVESLLGES